MHPFLTRLQQELGDEELVAKLRALPETPDLKLYRAVLGRPGEALVFRLVLALLPPSSAGVAVVNCVSYRVPGD